MNDDVKMPTMDAAMMAERDALARALAQVGIVVDDREDQYALDWPTTDRLLSVLHERGWSLHHATRGQPEEEAASEREREHLLDFLADPNASPQQKRRVLDAALAAIPATPDVGERLDDRRLAQVHRNFDAFKEWMTPSERGAVAAVLYIIRPEDLSDDDRRHLQERGLQLIAEHPEWAVSTEPTSGGSPAQTGATGVTAQDPPPNGVATPAALSKEPSE